jgi:hypothetical protein
MIHDVYIESKLTKQTPDREPYIVMKVCLYLIDGE